MGKCLVLGCPFRPQSGIYFRRLPKNKVLQEKWIKAINRPNWVPNRFSVICEFHFSDDCWERVREDGKRKMKASAIPTIFDTSNSSHNLKSNGPLERLESSNNVENNYPSQRLNWLNDGSSNVNSNIHNLKDFPKYTGTHGKSCAIPNCYSPISPLHRFPNPRKNYETFKIWVQLSGNKHLKTIGDLKIYNSYRVCGKHFTPEDISTNNRLKVTSVPTKLLPNQDVEYIKRNEKPVIFWVEPKTQSSEDPKPQSMLCESSVLVKEMPQNLETKESIKTCKIFTDGLIPKLLELDETIRLQVMTKINDVIRAAKPFGSV